MHQLDVRYTLHVGVVHPAVAGVQGDKWQLVRHTLLSVRFNKCAAMLIPSNEQQGAGIHPMCSCQGTDATREEEHFICDLQLKIVSWPRSSVTTLNEWGPQAARAVSAAILHGNSKRRLG